MATSYYSTGTITLTNGSAVVTGTGTAWSMALIASGNIFVQASGNPLPIATVDSDTQITAELAWTGTTGTYSYQIQLDQGLTNSAQNATNLAYLLAELRQGTIFKYDASGTLADRDLFDGRSKNFSYLVTTEGPDQGLYVKESSASGDWEGPLAYGRGPQGEQGPIGTLNPMGAYSAGTTYAANDNVLYQGSSWVALQSTVGNAPPTLPTTENAYWSLLAVKGTDGTGIGDMVKSVYDPQNLQLDAFARGSHTGTQPVSSITGLDALPDDALVLADPADGTKKGRFDVGLVAAGQSRVFTMPNRSLVINPSEEQIGATLDLAGAAAATWTGLDVYSDLFLDVEGTQSDTSGMTPYLVFSTDNGATFITSAGAYSFGGFAQEGAALGAVPIASATYFALTFTPLATSAHKARISLSAFNVAAATLVQSDFTYFSRANGTKRRDLMDGYGPSASIFNALRFGVIAGTFVRGRATLKGRR